MVKELRPFEFDIIRDFTEPDITRGRGKSTPRLGRWIRAHLQDVHEDYPYAMWQRWLEFCTVAYEQWRVNIPKNTYQQYTSYMWSLEKNNLIKVTREEPYQDKVVYRYYAVVGRNIGSELWNNPRRGSPNWEKWTKKRMPTGRPPGRPRTSLAGPSPF